MQKRNDRFAIGVINATQEKIRDLKEKKKKEEEEDLILAGTLRQPLKELTFKPGDEVWIYLQIEEMLEGFYKHTFKGVAGSSLIFYRTSKCGNQIHYSELLTDYQVGLVKIYNEEEFKIYKKQRAMEEIEKWERRE